MKTLSVIPLLFLVACSTSKTPKWVVRPQEPRPSASDSAVRYPEVTRAYYLGRYVDPHNDLLLHEEHVVYRVEANSHWNFRPGPSVLTASPLPTPSHDPAFAPLPVNDAILAEVNSQKAATTAVIAQARQLSGALEQFQAALNQTKANLQETADLRAAVKGLGKRLESLESNQQLPPPSVSTNAPTNMSPP